MGKIKTEGRVTLEFEPDLYEISIIVSAEDSSSGSAIIAGKKQAEALLHNLAEQLHIEPEQLSAEREAVERPRSYDSNNKDFYRFSRTLCLKISADNKLREAITDILSKMDNVTYTITEKLSDESEQKQMALDAAVQCAKQKAECLAASLQCKIVGFENILTNIANSGHINYKVRGIVPPSEVENLAANLQNPKIKLSGEVTVIWLTEPLT